MTYFAMAHQRKLLIQKIVAMIDEHLPMEREEFLAKVEYETGLTEKKAQEYLRLLFKMKKFKIIEKDTETILDKIDTKGNKDIE